eukprot:33960-Pyramimonas_sp.AAC.1
MAQVSLGTSELIIEFLLITLAFGWTLLGKGGVDDNSTGASHLSVVPVLGKLGLALSSGAAWKLRTLFFGAIASAQ